MIKFNCPSCGKRLGVPDKFAGSRAKCPKCKGIFQIPNIHPKEEIPFAAIEDAPSVPGKREPECSRQSPAQEVAQPSFSMSKVTSESVPGAKIDVRMLLGCIGSILLFIGVFTPVLSAPIIGNINYFRNGEGDGVFVLILAVVSLLLSLLKKYKALWLTGLGSLGVMLFSIIHFQVKMAETKSKMGRDLKGNPFKGIADAAIESIQMEWGWAILIMGAIVVVVAAAIKSHKIQFGHS